MPSRARFSLLSALLIIAIPLAGCGSGSNGDTPGSDDDPANARQLTTETQEDVPVEVELPASDTDGSPLTYSISRAPAHGRAQVDSGSTVHYSPDPDWNGSDTIQLDASDGNEFATQLELVVVIEPVNDEPTSISLNSISVDENAAGAVVGMLSTEDADIADTFSYTIVSVDGATGSGLFTTDGSNLVAVGELDYEAKSTYILRIRSSDEVGSSTEGESTVEVTDLNDPPVIQVDTNVAVDEYGYIRIPFTVTDQDGDELTANCTGTDHGSVYLDEVGTVSCVYTPEDNYVGGDSVVISVDDGTDRTTKTVYVTVEDGGTVRFR